MFSSNCDKQPPKMCPAPDLEPVDPEPDPISSDQIIPNRYPAFGPFENLECISFSHVNLVNEMRYLWLQMVIWSRAYIDNCTAKPEALYPVYERLHLVPMGFYNYMNLFFGQGIAEQFLQLMAQHIVIFGELVNALTAGDQHAANLSRSAWHGNSKNISEFMVHLSRRWDYNEWADLLNKYQKMLIDGTIATLTNDRRKEIIIYDRLQSHSLRIADYMSKGVMHNL